MKTTTTFTMVFYLLRCLNRIVLKHVIALSVLLSISLSGFSQNISEGPTSTQAKHTGFSFSVFAGGSMFGPKQNIKSAMISSGLNDAPQSNFHSSSVNGDFWSFIISLWESLSSYSSGTSGLAPTPAIKQDPTTKQYGVFDIDLTLYFAKHHGVSLNLASANNQVVEGYQALGFGYLGNYISIHSKITSLSTNYVLCTSDQRHNISLGPAYIVHTILEQGPNSTNTAKSSSYHRTQKKKFGIFMGYSFMVVQKRNWFIGFKANYRWIPSSVIGPYQYKVSAQTNKTTVSLTSEFPSTKVGLSNINIGVNIGLRSSN